MKSLEVTLGVYDNLEKQRQSECIVDLLRNNLAVLGPSMSGKTTILKTLLIRMHQVLGVMDREEIYILDFKNNLSEYGNLPYTAACFDALREENVRSLFHRVQERLEENILALPNQVFAESSTQPAHVTFIIDGLNLFLGEAKYADYHAQLKRMAQEGLSKGITVVVTADEPAGGVLSLLPSFRSVIALDMSKEQYETVFGTRIKKPISHSGRGLVSAEVGTYEFQAYFPYNSDLFGSSDASAVRETSDQMVRYSVFPRSTIQAIFKNCQDRKLFSFVKDLTKSEWSRYNGENYEEYRKLHNCPNTELIAGMDFYSFQPIRFDLLKARAIVIYGKKDFGKTNLLSLILEPLLTVKDACFVVWEDGREGVYSKNRGKKVYEQLQTLGTRLTVVRSQKMFEQHLFNNGYHDTSSGGMQVVPLNGVTDAGKKLFVPRNNPFTVFIVQSRSFYQASGFMPDNNILRLAPFVTDPDGAGKRLFIFSDAQRITDRESSTVFNTFPDHAFLLDNILRFINDRGQASVFGSLDRDDLKARFGDCERGDGFYFDLERDDLHKVKFIKQE